MEKEIYLRFSVLQAVFCFLQKNQSDRREFNLMIDALKRTLFFISLPGAAPLDLMV
jgi:hypothetical protein